MKITAYFDGACEPVNPGGTASYGAVIYNDGTKVWECSEIYKPEIPLETSNNIAEYLGIIAVLHEFIDFSYRNQETYIFGDSKLVVEQMNGRWEIRNGLYVPFARKALSYMHQFTIKPNISWIPREQNTIADELSKARLLKAGIKVTKR